MSGQFLVLDIETEEALYEKREYLTRQLIAYIGNKRALLTFIGGRN